MIAPDRGDRHAITRSRRRSRVEPERGSAQPAPDQPASVPCLPCEVAGDGRVIANERVPSGTGPASKPAGTRRDVDGNPVARPRAARRRPRVRTPRRPIGRIGLAERCAGVPFGGSKRNRPFMAARQSLYAIDVGTQGAPAGSRTGRDLEPRSQTNSRVRPKLDGIAIRWRRFPGPRRRRRLPLDGPLAPRPPPARAPNPRNRCPDTLFTARRARSRPPPAQGFPGSHGPSKRSINDNRLRLG